MVKEKLSSLKSRMLERERTRMMRKMSIYLLNWMNLWLRIHPKVLGTRSTKVKTSKGSLKLKQIRFLILKDSHKVTLVLMKPHLWEFNLVLEFMKKLFSSLKEI